MLEAVWTLLRRWCWMRDQRCLNQAGFSIIMDLISGRFDHTHTAFWNDYCVCPKKGKCSLHFELSFCFAVKAKSNSPLYRCISNNSCVKTCWSSSELQRLTECVVLWDKSRDIFWSEASRLGTRCAGDGGRPCLMPQVSNSFNVHLDS